MSKPPAIFIAATGQNVGKTTLCLGLIAGLKKRFNAVGFIKPVGQLHVKVDGKFNVDKDVVLFKEHFQLPADWQDMSPVIIPPGFTRDFLDNKVSEEVLQSRILNAFQKISAANAYTIVEGTGHIGVGSVINMNNAKVAKALGLDVVVIASGGLGSTHDELALNISMCQDYGVKVRGVILNRVVDEKLKMILDYFPKTLKKWGIPLIGCVPYNDLLGNPSIKDFEYLFSTALISGERRKYHHYNNLRLVAGSLDAYKEEMQPNELIITPASREDIIMAIVQRNLESSEIDGVEYGSGLILTSRYPPTQAIINQIRKADFPALYAPLCSYDAMKMITSFIAKIRTEDVVKVKKAIKLVEENVNFESLLLKG